MAVDVVVDLDTGSVTAVVSGTIDFSNVGRLRRHLLDLVAMTHASRVLVDLDAARFADPPGGAALVHALRVSRQRGIDLRVRCDRRSETGRTLAVLGLGLLLEPSVAASEDACLSGR
jgi:anti-anti-sigma factor